MFEDNIEEAVMMQRARVFFHGKTHYFWNILFSTSLSLNLVNFYALDVVYTLLFMHGVLHLKQGAPKEKIASLRDRFFFSGNLFNYLVVLFLLSGIVGYITASPMTATQIQEIFDLRWILGFYSFYYAGKKLSETQATIKLEPLILIVPIGMILLSHWSQTKGHLIYPDIRIQGFYQNPNHLALAILLPWAFLLGQTSIRNKEITPIRPFLAKLITLALTSIVLIATYSRSSWSGVALCCFVTLFYTKNRKFIYAMVSVFALISVIFTLNLFNFRDRIAYSLDLSEHSSQNLRILAWKASWQIFLDHPFFGVGFSENARMFSRYYAQLGFSQNDVIGNCHNQYLEALTGAGAIGLIAYLGIFTVGLIFFHRTFRNTDDSSIKRTALSCILVIIALLGSSFTDTPFRLHEARNFIMIILGFGFGYLHNVQKKEPLPKEANHTPA